MPKAMSERKSEFALATACLAVVFTVGIAAWPQAPTFNITVTGQSMIRGDIRVHTPSVVSTIAPLLKGDVIFTNFEATVIEKGQSPQEATGRFLSPPEALDALKELGFNLLALSDNHSFDFKVTGIQNTLREVTKRDIVHAGIGEITEELPERLAPAPWLQKWTHEEIDAGADLIVMRGAPLIHGVEIYRGRPIFYDLGNFIFNLPPAYPWLEEPINFKICRVRLGHLVLVAVNALLEG